MLELKLDADDQQQELECQKAEIETAIKKAQTLKWEKSPSEIASFLYTLSDPVTGEMCYVGRTEDPQKRYVQHGTNKGVLESLGLLEEGPTGGITLLQTYYLRKVVYT